MSPLCRLTRTAAIDAIRLSFPRKRESIYQPALGQIMDARFRGHDKDRLPPRHHHVVYVYI